MDSHPISKAELLRMLRAGQGEWEQLLALAPTDQLEQPIRPGWWSVRDLLAHILWYEQEGLALCRDGVARTPEMWEQSIDEINAEIVVAAQTMSGIDVLAAWRATFQELYDLVDENDEAWLAGTVAYPNMKPVKRSEQIQMDTIGHYREHLDDLRAWLEGEKG